MKAAYIEKFGGPEVLKYGDLPDPVAGPGQVVVDTVAASVNGADPKVRAGDYDQPKFPVILGRDFSGVVSALGAGVAGSERRRRGVRCAGGAAATGPIARRSPSAPPSSPRSRPGCRMSTPRRSRSPVSPPLRSVEDTLKLKSGETILIQGGAGGVAGFAIQLAKHLGARVITTASTANLGYRARPRRR